MARVGEMMSAVLGGVESPAETGMVPIRRAARESPPSWRKREMVAGGWSGMRRRPLSLS